MKPDDGSMAVAMSGAVAMVAIVSIAVAGLGALYSARAQAQTAADAAALAAAVATYPAAATTSPVAAARIGADENGANVLSCACPRDGTLEARVVGVVVGIEVDVPIFGEWVVKASSRAEFDPLRWLGR